MGLWDSTAKMGKVERNILAQQWEETLSIHALLSGFIFYVLNVGLIVKKLNDFIDLCKVLPDQFFPTQGKQMDERRAGV